MLFLDDKKNCQDFLLTIFKKHAMFLFTGIMLHDGALFQYRIESLLEI